MDDLQKIFDGCRALYEQCYENVKEMSCSIAEIMESEGKRWDPKITTGKFDVVLQYSLLQIAVADFDLDKNEVVFIRDLTKQGDFVNYINAVANTKITWEGLYNSQINNLRSFLNDIEPVMEDLSNEFVNVFAVCDKATEYDFAADLEKNIVLIITGLAHMDGSISKSELKQSCVILGAVNRIKELKK